jgi:hypothetical protein
MTICFAEDLMRLPLARLLTVPGQKAFSKAKRPAHGRPFLPPLALRQYIRGRRLEMNCYPVDRALVNESLSFEQFQEKCAAISVRNCVKTKN